MPIKYIQPNEKSYPLSDICVTLFVRLISFFSASTCFVLFEVTFLCNFFSLSSKSVYILKSSISALVSKFFACFNLAETFLAVNLVNFGVVIYLQSWAWSSILFSISPVFMW